MTDPYKVLGVVKSASADDVKAAYRKLAKKLHPDLNPGDADIERRFKEVSQAYGIVGDSEKRKRFDRGEINASGQETAPAGAGPGFYRRYAGSNEGAKYSRFEFGPEFDAQDIFSDLFGQRARRPVRRGADVSYAVKVDFVEAALGAKKRVQLADGKTLDITLKPGTEDGQTLRLKGQGQAAQGQASQGQASQGKAGRNEAPAGDALIRVRVSPHRFFVRQGRDIHLELPITLKEAVLGASVPVPTIHGKVALKVPAGANSGQTLRLRGKGVPAGAGKPAGDQLVKITLVLPEEPDTALNDFVEGWDGADEQDPRRKAGLD
jgi:DnaJ-class molecular chaperone